MSTQVYRISNDLDPAFGARRLVVTLSVPQLPPRVRNALFAEHVQDRRTGAMTDTVVAITSGGVIVSVDNGLTWDYVPIPEASDLQLRNVFTCDDGGRLVQSAESRSSDEPVSVIRCDADFRATHLVNTGTAPWHGSRSIDEAGGQILYAEYPYNGVRYPKGDDIRARRDCAVYQSSDGGCNWTMVYEVSGSEIRHFHTIVADPHSPGVWWLSSGDLAAESRVWRSADHGHSWTDVTGAEVDITMHPGFQPTECQRAYRYTDLTVLPDSLLWGSDDSLGTIACSWDLNVRLEPRIGSGVFITPKSQPLRPRAIGYIGNPVRSMIDVGEGWLLITEAKRPDILPRPQVALLAKTEPYVVQHLAGVPCFHPYGTSFTHSRASRALQKGRFFTARGSSDVFREGHRILQWDVEFE